jgi:YD repeat-containing protein
MTYDNNGNLATLTENRQTTTYTWDARDRLASLSGPGLTASFAYDGKGRRTQKTITGFISTFQYDGADIVREVAGGSGVSYLRGLAIDEHLARIEDGGSTTCYAPDALGSTVALTDSGGGVATEYTY